MNNVITENIATWTTAPNGIKKLRELILELAVRGLLVPQDANDEPASELLKGITTEKARLITEGQIKLPKSFAKISEAEKPFALPNGWEWARVVQLFQVTSGGSFDITSEMDSGEFIYLKVGDMNIPGNEHFISTSSRFINPTDKELRGIIPANSIIFPKRGGAIATNKKRLIASEIFVDLNIMAITVPKSISLIYTFYWLSGIDLAQLNSGTSVPQINHKDIEPLLFPLPPIKEQHRIVAKVDELMQLCDQLEQKQSGNQQTHHQLVSTLLTTLTEAADAQAFQTIWSHITANFDCLFTTESSIEQLKQTILQLAVMGKLVPQNPNDKPASELLKKIATEKALLIAEGKIKKQNPLPKISEEEKPFALPDSWEWTRLGEISQINPRNKVDDELEVSFVPMSLISTSYKGEHKQEKKQWSEIKTSFTHFAEGDIGVAKITPCFENGKAAVFSELQNGYGAGTTELHIVRPFNKTLISRYALIYLKSPQFLLVGESKMTGTAGQKRLPKDFVANNAFPLPPLTEQHRIVAKVDELMALCEQLKTKLATAQALQQQLAETLVQQAVA